MRKITLRLLKKIAIRRDFFFKKKKSFENSFSFLAPKKENLLKIFDFILLIKSMENILKLISLLSGQYFVFSLHSECFINKRSRYSNNDISFSFLFFFSFHFVFEQGDSPFGKTEAYIKLEQLGEGSYATVYKGYSK